MKSCSKCKEVLDETFFPIDKRKKNGLKSECKKCHNKFNRLSRGDNYSMSKEYFKSKLTRSGFTTLDLNDNKSLIELKKQLLILKRTIKWSNLKM